MTRDIKRIIVGLLSLGAIISGGILTYASQMEYSRTYDEMRYWETSIQMSPEEFFEVLKRKSGDEYAHGSVESTHELQARMREQMAEVRSSRKLEIRNAMRVASCLLVMAGFFGAYKAFRAF